MSKIPVLITSDIDWAPDYAIRYMVDKLNEANVKATFFATHDTPELGIIRESKNLELGIHPNFLENSSHGKSPDEVMSYCLGLVPEAVSLRTHALLQSTYILQKVMETKIENDCSLFLPFTPNITPHNLNLGGKNLLFRCPYSWEDDIAQLDAKTDWDLNGLPEQNNYLMLNFHPILVYLNDSDGGAYKKLKAQYAKISAAPKEAADKLKNSGKGPGAAFLKAIEMAKANSLKVKELKNALAR